MLKFVDVNQETPVKRKTDNRKRDFNEIYDQYITDKAKEQSVDALNVAYLFVKFIVHYKITFLIGLSLQLKVD